MINMEYIFFGIGLLISGISVWFIQYFRYALKRGIPLHEVEELKRQITNLEIDKAKNYQKIDILENDLKVIQKKLENSLEIRENLSNDLTREETERICSEAKIGEQRKEFEQIKAQLKTDFENLANSIIENKSEKFTKQNQENIDSLLKPLNKEIKEFKDKVDFVYNNDNRDRSVLREQIINLTKLNEKMSVEANNLTNALKGDNKTMGMWGEMILETVLNSSGLIEGDGYSIQESFKNKEGKKSQPDVIINLPDNNHLIIDSKVSLVAYEKYCTSDIQNENVKTYLKEHIKSIRNHIDSLSKKNYQDLYQISTPDFVLMFIPLDPALITAFQKEPKLFMDAFDKGIFLVSPATLLFALRTIANIWRRESQNKNALEIAEKSGDLYDKFVAFHEQLLKLGTYLDKTRECYDDSINKLTSGNGNLIRRVEVIKKLGAKTNKSLPVSVIEKSESFNFESCEKMKSRLG